MFWIEKIQFIVSPFIAKPDKGYHIRSRKTGSDQAE
jgi:hypothetical protein